VSTAARIQALRAKTVANGCSEAEARSAAAKVAELLGAQVTLPPELPRDEAAEVLSHLYKLGYELIPEAESRLGGRLHRRFIENDDGLNCLKNHLIANTPMRRLGSQAAAEFWRKLLAGRRVMEPEQHPSGHRTSEAAHTKVHGSGQGMHTSARSRT
jgi:hypothetical protein